MVDSESNKEPAMELNVANGDGINAGGIYRELACHQVTEQWHGRDILGFLQEWADRFNVEFKLDVPQVAHCIEQLPAHIGAVLSLWT